jgi:hypothetical protein
MSFNNVLIFTGRFTYPSNSNPSGKNLYIPLTQPHPAITLKITGIAWPGPGEASSLMIAFTSPEEREIVANFNFTNEIFYVDP